MIFEFFIVDGRFIPYNRSMQNLLLLPKYIRQEGFDIEFVKCDQPDRSIPPEVYEGDETGEMLMFYQLDLCAKPDLFLDLYNKGKVTFSGTKEGDDYFIDMVKRMQPQTNSITPSFFNKN